MTLNNCPFCVDLCKTERPRAFTYLVKCTNCGVFQVEDTIVEDPHKDLAKLAIVAMVRKLHGRDRYFLHEDDSDVTANGIYGAVSVSSFLSELPQGVEVFDKSLYNLSLICPNVYDSFNMHVRGNADLYKHIFYCQNAAHARQVFNMMHEMGYLTGGHPESFISSEGWARLHDLKANIISDTAFVAMWFDDRTSLFRESVKTAVENAGYNSNEILVDEAHHNDYIMDKVINMIDDSRFVIADFTSAPEREEGNKVIGGARGGVYFEAGYARGKGKQVIHTCSSDEESGKRRHFDVDQINTIFWNEDGGVLKAWGHDFIDVLTQRIIATVGRGPLGK